MRYITIIMVVIVFWFLQGIGLTLLIQDTLLVSASAEGNTSFAINTSDINMTTNEFSEKTTLRSFPSALKIMFTFRTPKIEGLPSLVGVIISFVNWFLVIMLGISVYRVINPLA